MIESLAPGAQAGPGAVTLEQRIPGQSVMATLLGVPDRLSPTASSGLRRIFGANPLSSESWPWYQGALGEIEVGEILARLDSTWTVLHAVPVGSAGADIDHVVIGAAGVFTINTKHHAGQKIWVADRMLMVAGHKQGHIRNSIHESSRAIKLLSAAAGIDVPVAGLIVVVGAKELKIKKVPSGTTVLTAPRLLRWLGKRPLVLTEDQVAHIAAIAKQPGTWQRTPQDSGNAAEIQDSFRQLHQRVQAARRRRRTWGYGGMIAFAVSVMALIATVPAIISSFVIPWLAP